MRDLLLLTFPLIVGVYFLLFPDQLYMLIVSVSQQTRCGKAHTRRRRTQFTLRVSTGAKRRSLLFALAFNLARISIATRLSTLVLQGLQLRCFPTGNSAG
jgi:hypothetical protein